MKLTCLPDSVLDEIDSRSGDYLEGGLIDAGGRAIRVGDTVLRAGTFGRTALMYLSEVTRIEDRKLYLDDSKVRVRYPGRLLIVQRMETT